MIAGIAARATKMSNLKEKLMQKTELIDGVECRPSPVAGAYALFYRGKEFGHFHSDDELDLRLTKKLIHALGLSHPGDSTFHPNRSANSPWIELRFRTEADVAKIVSLVKLAAEQR